MAVFNTKVALGEGMKVELVSGKHKLIIDEPKNMGGTDLGMNPLEALLGSLGACKCIVARFFAAKYKIDLQELRIELEGELDPSGFMGTKKDAKIGFSKITSKVFIKSTSPEEDIIKFVDFIEKNCPVYDTIINTPEMMTEITIEK